jgi:hypothetical protein
MVTITLRVLSRPDTKHLPIIYQSLGLDYDERVLPSIGNEVLKSIVAQFDAAELITQREVVGYFYLCTVVAREKRIVLAGLFTHSGGSVCACRGVQHQARGCVYHTSHVWKGTNNPLPLQPNGRIDHCRTRNLRKLSRRSRSLNKVRQSMHSINPETLT